ncbi:MAG: arginyltransferase [Magnetococcales bacterium]|nr:arginyltransferase [Magnetococcales bacterium]NGZ05883.1 arginyltransferase [Magnetococcales bacterium]
MTSHSQSLNSGPPALEMILSPPHPCGYLSHQTAHTLHVHPVQPMDMNRFEYLLATGFRRSGNLVYRPWCSECAGCIPVRVRVADFQMTRGLRRVIRRNHDLTIRTGRPTFSGEHFRLYQRYLDSRHGDGPMADPNPEDFMEFLHSDWCAVRFIDFRWRGRLIQTAVIDQLRNALSAVYTFFDPKESARSLGTLAILWEIEMARQMELDWLYLGYWIADCPKMRYKSRFQPLEAYVNRRWILMPDHPE